jgi:four helix bundle protein
VAPEPDSRNPFLGVRNLFNLAFLRIAILAVCLIDNGAIIRVYTGTASAAKGGMAVARRHTELDAWRLSDELKREVRRLLELPAFRRDPDLRGQLRRSARGRGPNIAEGFYRFKPKDFARFVRIARGSLAETMEHLNDALEEGLLQTSETRNAMTLANRAIGACTNLIKYLDSASPPGRET